MKRQSFWMKTLAVLMTSICLVACGDKTPDTKTVLVSSYKKTDYNDEKVTYEYDKEGRLILKTEQWGGSDGVKTEYAYDEQGRLLTVKTNYGQEKPIITTYSYNEKGDTLLVMNECYEEGYYVQEKKVYDYDADGKRTHLYEYHAYPPEGEGCDYEYMCHAIEYDKEGHKVKSTGLDVDYENMYGQGRMSIDKTVATSAQAEWEKMIKQDMLGKVNVATYEYDKEGRIVQVVSKLDGEEVMRKHYTYNSKNLLAECKTHYEGMVNDYVDTYTYDSENRPLTYTNLSGDYKSVAEVKYTDKGDTLMLVKWNTYEGTMTVERKEVHTYREDGSLACVYCYTTVDDWGCDNHSATLKMYNEQGLLVKVTSYEPEDYTLAPVVTTDLPADVEADFKAWYEKFGMKQKWTEELKYATLKLGEGIVKE